jgi:hypothetical protein
MISANMKNWLDAQYGDFRDWNKYLQDYTDDQIKDVIKKYSIATGSKLITILRHEADPADEERISHLLGFSDAADRRELLSKVKALQDKCHEP